MDNTTILFVLMVAGTLALLTLIVLLGLRVDHLSKRLRRLELRSLEERTVMCRCVSQPVHSDQFLKVFRELPNRE